MSGPSQGSENVVAMIGLGAMGLPMAARMAEAFSVRGYDISRERLADAASDHVVACESPMEAVHGARVVFVAVRNRVQLKAVLFGDAGIVRHLVPGTIVVVNSTVGVDAIRSVGRQLHEAGFGLVDAPMSGGPVRAREGDLLVIASGSDESLETAAPYLQQIASTLSVIGSRPGDAQAVKTVNQLLCGVHIAAAAEALALAKSFGLQLDKTLEILQAGAARSFMLGDRGPRVIQALDGDASPVHSRLDIFVKDLGIVNAAAREAHVPIPVAAAAEGVFRIGLNQGLGDRDDSNVVKVISR